MPNHCKKGKKGKKGKNKKHIRRTPEEEENETKEEETKEEDPQTIPGQLPFELYYRNREGQERLIVTYHDFRTITGKNLSQFVLEDEESAVEFDFSCLYKKLPPYMLYHESSEGSGLGLALRQKTRKVSCIPTGGRTSVPGHSPYARVHPVRNDRMIAPREGEISLSDYCNTGFPNSTGAALSIRTIAKIMDVPEAAFTENSSGDMVSVVIMGTHMDAGDAIFWAYYNRLQIKDGYLLLAREKMRESFSSARELDDLTIIQLANRYIQMRDKRIDLIYCNKSHINQLIAFQQLQYVITTPSALLDLMIENILNFDDLDTMRQLTGEDQFGISNDENAISSVQNKELNYLSTDLLIELQAAITDASVDSAIIRDWIDNGNIEIMRLCFSEIGRSLEYPIAQRVVIFEQIQTDIAESGLDNVLSENANNMLLEIAQECGNSDTDFFESYPVMRGLLVARVIRSQRQHTITMFQPPHLGDNVYETKESNDKPKPN